MKTESRICSIHINGKAGDARTSDPKTEGTILILKSEQGKIMIIMVPIT
jgi:hypothetical protein